ncbi:hypothetical protein CEXT_68451 [Caerostris extrusa]|uniref:Uncharacterized protein n=1 Tax=Caerostris extrusa TaxID=172846 RepID=A0AAV4QIB8_CAEEX|nr:hypothetical protein CEXT_68451 [Caerostris extrusa]
MHLPFLRAQHGFFCGCIHLYAGPLPAQRRKCAELIRFLATSKSCINRSRKASSAAKSLAVREHKEMGSQMVVHFMTVPFFFLPARKSDPSSA